MEEAAEGATEGKGDGMMGGKAPVLAWVVQLYLSIDNLAKHSSKAWGRKREPRISVERFSFIS